MIYNFTIYILRYIYDKMLGVYFSTQISLTYKDTKISVKILRKNRSNTVIFLYNYYVNIRFIFF